MAHGGDNLLCQIGGSDSQGGGVNARVTAEKLSFEYILVHEQLYPMGMIVHQTENTQTAGGGIEEFFHKFSCGKGKSGGADFLGEHAGFEGFISRQHQQIESGILPVA